MSNPIQIVAFAGPAGSGKDTAGQYLIDKYGFKRLSFAGPIYDALESMGFGRPSTQEEKEAVLPWLGVSWRHMAQTLGTEWGRMLVHANLWIKIAEQRIRGEGGRFVITDLRFENESALVREMKGIVCHLEGRAHEMAEGTLDHASEAGIHILDGDTQVDNSTTLEELHTQLDQVVRYVGVQ